MTLVLIAFIITLNTKSSNPNPRSQVWKLETLIPYRAANSEKGQENFISFTGFLHLRLLLPQETSLLELQYWVSWTKIGRRARMDEQTASVRKMPITFPSSAPGSQPVIELARERGAHYGAGSALIRTAIIHSFNASSRNEWEYRMASNNNNNKSTILLTYTHRPLSLAQSENTNAESATRRSCAFARQGQKLRPLMRRERQAGSEGGRESSEREGVGGSVGARGGG
jgi:hypothetical protein